MDGENMSTEEVENTETQEEETLDALAVEEQEPEQAPQEEEIPEKYKGKSLAELIRMNEETQQFVGRQANELGELRKSVDQIIQSNLPKEAPEDPPDWFEDPDAALNARLESHPTIQSAKQTSELLAKERAKSELLSAHPDASKIISDPKFLEWRDSSNFRKRLWDEAQSYSAEAAVELLTLYKERQGVVKQTEEVEKGQRKQDVRRASTGSAKGTGNAPAKTFRRADIIQLMKTDPARYEKLSSEIRAAYQAGRVK